MRALRGWSKAARKEEEAEGAEEADRGHGRKDRKHRYKVEEGDEEGGVWRLGRSRSGGSKGGSSKAKAAAAADSSPARRVASVSATVSAARLYCGEVQEGTEGEAVEAGQGHSDMWGAGKHSRHHRSRSGTALVGPNGSRVGSDGGMSPSMSGREVLAGSMGLGTASSRARDALRRAEAGSDRHSGSEGEGGGTRGGARGDWGWGAVREGEAEGDALLGGGGGRKGSSSHHRASSLTSTSTRGKGGSRSGDGVKVRASPLMHPSSSASLQQLVQGDKPLPLPHALTPVLTAQTSTSAFAAAPEDVGVLGLGSGTGPVAGMGAHARHARGPNGQASLPGIQPSTALLRPPSPLPHHARHPSTSPLMSRASSNLRLDGLEGGSGDVEVMGSWSHTGAGQHTRAGLLATWNDGGGPGAWSGATSNTNRSHMDLLSLADKSGAGGRADGTGEQGGRGGGVAQGRRKTKDDEDDEDSFGDRFAAHPVVAALSRTVDRIMMSQTVAILLDVLDVLLFTLDMYTDARVVETLHAGGYTEWHTLTLLFITWHFALTAILVVAYWRRTSSHWSLCGGALTSDSFRAWAWLPAIPLAIPVVIALDLCMLLTSTLPIFFPRIFANFSSFMSNYNFSRLFIEFVFESIPQTILQTYIYYHLLGITQVSQVGMDTGPPPPPPSTSAGDGPGGLGNVHVLDTSAAAQRAVVLSLTISSINCVKFGWKLWKAADDAGLRMAEYFKYVLLLKGNYECAPATLAVVHADTCALRGDTWVMNGFRLHRDKARFGPAQQAYILLNAFERVGAREGVTRWQCSGCPLASINRIVEKGLKHFKNLEVLELSECALRGDTATFNRVCRAIKRHRALNKVKLVQTGILRKYRNVRVEGLAALLKPKLGLRGLAVCGSFWGDALMAAAAEHARAPNSPLESIAIEFPAGSASQTAAAATKANDEAADTSGREGSGKGAGLAALLPAMLPGAAGAALAALTSSVGGVLHSAGGVLSSAGGTLTTVGGGLLSVTLSPLAAVVGLPFMDRSSKGQGQGGVVSAAYVSSAASLIADAPALSRVALHNHGLPLGGAATLMSAVASNTRLVRLSLAGTSLGVEGAAALARALASHPSLSHLCLQQCQLGGEGVTAVAAALVGGAPCLSYLDLSGNMLVGGDALTGGASASAQQAAYAAVSALARAVRLSTSLTALKLEHWGEALLVTAPSAAQSGGGHTEWISSSPLASAGQVNGTAGDMLPPAASERAGSGGNLYTGSSKSIANLTHYQQQLRAQLQAAAAHHHTRSHSSGQGQGIHSQGVSEGGAAGGAAGVVAHVSRRGTLGWDGGNSALALLCSAVAASPRLTRLSLNSTTLRLAGARCVGRMLAGAPHLVALDLGVSDKVPADARIPDEGVEALAHGLRSCIPATPSLTHLNLSGQQIGPRGALALAEALPAVRGLMSLDVGRCGLGDAEVACLVVGLQALPRLHTLGLAGVTSLGLRGARAIAELMHSGGGRSSSGDNADSRETGTEGQGNKCMSGPAPPFLTHVASWRALSIGGDEEGEEVKNQPQPKEPPGLRSLNLSFSSLGGPAVNTSAAAADPSAVEAARLEVLATVSMLANALPTRGCVLAHLALAYCGLPEEGVYALATAIASAPHLCVLDLAGTPEHVARAAFTPVLTRSNAARTLKVLKCTSRDGSHEVIDI